MKRPNPALNVLMIALAIAAISLFWTDNLITAAILLAISAITLSLWRDAGNLVRYALAACVGTLGEIVCIISGAWAYSNPTIFVPLWLPLGWGLMGVHLPVFSEWVMSKTPSRARPKALKRGQGHKQASTLTGARRSP